MQPAVRQEVQKVRWVKGSPEARCNLGLGGEARVELLVRHGLRVGREGLMSGWV